MPFGDDEVAERADPMAAEAVPAEDTKEVKPPRAGGAATAGEPAIPEGTASPDAAPDAPAAPDERSADGSAPSGEPRAESVLAAPSAESTPRASSVDVTARGAEGGAAPVPHRQSDVHGEPVAPPAAAEATRAEEAVPVPSDEAIAGRTGRGGGIEMTSAARPQVSSASADPESPRQDGGAGKGDERQALAPASPAPLANAGAASAAAAAPFSAAAMRAVAPAATESGRGSARELLIEAVQGSAHDVAEAAAIEARATSELSAARAAPTVAEAGRALPGQLAEAARMLRDGPVELRLSPEELGRVRMTLTAADGQMTLSISAERGETLDLLRRNIDQLAQDFREMGYESLAFSFGREGTGGQGAASGDEAGGAADALAALDETLGDAAAPRRPVRIDGAGLDLRL